MFSTSKMNWVVLAGLAVGMSGCAHSMMRGTVAMKVSDTEAHVCMGDNEVKAGDKVSLFKNVCHGGRSALGRCEKVKLGEGEITQTLNEHYSVMRVTKGVSFDEGTVVERQ